MSRRWISRASRTELRGPVACQSCAAIAVRTWGSVRAGVDFHPHRLLPDSFSLEPRHLARLTLTFFIRER